MSRPRKLHKPLKADFNKVLTAIGLGSGKGKTAATKLAKEKASPPNSPPKKP